MKKKRVVVIGLKGLPAFGGAAAVGENIVNQLKGEYDFTVLSISTHTDLPSGEYNGVKQVVFKSIIGKKSGLNTAYYYFVSLLYVLFHKFDIAHLHHASSGFIAPLISLKCKLILTVHAYGEGNDPKFSRLLNYLGMASRRLAVSAAHKVTAVSLFDIENMSKVFKKEIIYIPNGTNLVEATTAKSDECEPYILFSAGRIYNIKGLDLLLDAANKLGLDLKIKVAGDIDRVPSYKAEMLKKAESLNVELLGLIKDKGELMRIVSGAELFVFPSRYEAMSMMLLEVASMRTPIVASDIPANTNILSSEEVLFFTNGDSEDLAQKMEYALSRMNEMQERTHKAYDKLITKYTWNKIAQQYSAVYEQV
ncbi:MAG: glycosyltransferase family 4 protein [Rikenellaceae bacterium]